jgi:hypothetical protein
MQLTNSFNRDDISKAEALAELRELESELIAELASILQKYENQGLGDRWHELHVEVPSIKPDVARYLELSIARFSILTLRSKVENDEVEL